MQVNRVITARIATQFRNSPPFKLVLVRVEEDGTATLDGSVGSYVDKQQLQFAFRGLKEVTKVVNNVAVSN